MLAAIWDIWMEPNATIYQETFAPFMELGGFLGPLTARPMVDRCPNCLTCIGFKSVSFH